MTKVEFIPGNERNLYLGKLKNSIGRIYGTTRWRVITFAKKGTKHAQDWEFASRTKRRGKKFPAFGRCDKCGWRIDFCESLYKVGDCCCYDCNGTDVHNNYPMFYHECCYEVKQ